MCKIKPKYNKCYKYTNSVTCALYFLTMSLARITERINEQKQQKGKIDGRRFNSRSQKKMVWQVRDIQRGCQKKIRSGRGGYSKEELEEYRLINIKEREDSSSRLCVKEIMEDLLENVIKIADSSDDKE